MQTDSDTATIPTLTIRQLSSAADIPPAVWSWAPPGHPFLNPHFLPLLEAHGAAGNEWGWGARHLLAEDASGAPLGCLPLYLKTNSYGDFTGDWAWAGAYRQLGLAYYPKLFSGIPHTPATTPRFLLAPGPQRAAVRQQLIAAAQAWAEAQGFSSWHVAFPTLEDQADLEAAGLLLSHDVQFHWRDLGYGDFDGFLATYSAEKRRKVRAERRKVTESGLRLETRHGHDIDPAEWPALHGLYQSTFDKFHNHAVFTAECFAALGGALGDRMVVFIARQPDKLPVAVSICFRSHDTLYGRYWGCRGHYPGLHFELCFYQGIAYCLAHGLSCFEPGAGGEHKIARGFAPTTVPCQHWINDPKMRALIARHLKEQHHAVEDYRQEASSHLPFRSTMPTFPHPTPTP